MCVCLCVKEVGSLGGGTTAVMHSLYFVLCGREEDAVREQQLKWTYLGSSKLKWMQSGNSSRGGYSLETAAEVVTIGVRLGVTA